MKEVEVMRWIQDMTREKKEELEEKQGNRLQIGEYEETIRKLTVLFHEGNMSEESYKTAIKSLEERIEQLGGKTRERVAYPISKPKAYEKSYSNHYIVKPSNLWYLVPFFFSIIGGLIGYVAVRNEDEDMASNLLYFGIFMFFVDLFIAWAYYTWLMSLFSI